MIETKRLILRKWVINDAECLFELASDPNVGLPAGWKPHTCIEESKNIIATRFHRSECYCICDKMSGKPMGAIELKMKEHSNLAQSDLECELGFWLGKTFWGKGYMSEAAQLLIDRAFLLLGMETIWSFYYEGNARSKKTLVRLGFIYQHTIDEEVPALHEDRISHVNRLSKVSWTNKRNHEQL